MFQPVELECIPKESSELLFQYGGAVNCVLYATEDGIIVPKNTELHTLSKNKNFIQKNKWLIDARQSYVEDSKTTTNLLFDSRNRAGTFVYGNAVNTNGAFTVSKKVDKKVVDANQYSVEEYGLDLVVVNKSLSLIEEGKIPILVGEHGVGRTYHAEHMGEILLGVFNVFLGSNFESVVTIKVSSAQDFESVIQLLAKLPVNESVLQYIIFDDITEIDNILFSNLPDNVAVICTGDRSLIQAVNDSKNIGVVEVAGSLADYRNSSFDVFFDKLEEHFPEPDSLKLISNIRSLGRILRSDKLLIAGDIINLLSNPQLKALVIEKCKDEPYYLADFLCKDVSYSTDFCERAGKIK